MTNFTVIEDNPSTQAGNVRPAQRATYGENAPERGLQDGYDSSDDEFSASFPSSHPLPLHSGISRQSSFVDEDEEPITTTVVSPKVQSEPPVTWSSLPKKGQLAILTLARLSEPLAERSLSAYMFYQLRSFDPSLPDSRIASQGGILTASFAAAQFLTAVWWGRAADTEWIGRKRVLLVGLTGTCLSSIGVGFSKTFTQALGWRLLAGALNGNVGVMRTMISEIIEEKK
jgi:Major Facilitator Superfamily